MKPNAYGGQTFNEPEVGVLRNALFQVSETLARYPDATDPDSNDRFNDLASRFSPPPTRNTLAERVKSASLAITEEVGRDAGNPTFTANITQTQLMMNCVGWLVRNQGTLIPGVTTQEQLTQAQAMLDQFVGNTATQAVITQE